MKKFLYLFFAFLLPIYTSAKTFDFNTVGNTKANDILKETIIKKIPEFNGKTIGYFYDIDSDNESEIIGIAKYKLFYSLKGYKLFILKHNNNHWSFMRNDIYFDPTLNFEINNDEIIYFESIYNKTKKHKTKINKKLDEVLVINKANKKMIEPHEGYTHNDFILSDFAVEKQKNVNINYTNLSSKTKHYLDLK